MFFLKVSEASHVYSLGAELEAVVRELGTAGSPAFLSGENFHERMHRPADDARKRNTRRTESVGIDCCRSPSIGEGGRGR